jgi:hypothetical protein
MRHYSILIGCDQSYYDDWGIALLQSIHYNNPWIKLRCHIVNPINAKELDFVSYTTENISFLNDESKISYLQAARFLAASKIPNSESLIVVDTDTICTRSFTEAEFKTLFTKQYVMQHHKSTRWLACLVSFGNTDFRKRYAELLTSIPVEEWKWGRDQKILGQMSTDYNFSPVGQQWINSGKNKTNGVFLTLKGEQKTTDKYLVEYNKYKV